MLSWVGSRCGISTKAMPVSAGSAVRSFLKASSPHPQTHQCPPRESRSAWSACRPSHCRRAASVDWVDHPLSIALPYRLFAAGADPMSALFACLPKGPTQTGYNRVLRSHGWELRVRGEERSQQFLGIFGVWRPHPTWGYDGPTIVGPKGNIQ